MHFKATQLGNVIKFATGKAIKPGGTGQFPAYGSNGIIGGSERYHFENAVVIGRVGAYCGSVMYCPDRFWASDNTLVALPISNEFDIRFLYYLLRNANLRQYAGGAAQPLVTQSILKEIPVRVPRRSDQLQIAGILAAYDDLASNNERRIELLEKIARCVYKERIASPTKANGSAGMLGDLCELVKEPFFEKQHGSRPLVDLSRIPQKFIAPIETGNPNELTTSRIAFESGDTLFGAIRCYLHKVVAAPFPGVTNTSVLVLRPRFPWFRALLAIVASDSETIRWAEAHSTGTKMPVINWGVFRSMPIPALSEELAKDYEDIAGKILDQIGLHAQEIRNLLATRDLLMPRLLSDQT